mmetsp:Transcript_7110/g.11803  ORF Transcript_7110/g.11803 Transcript_7110/m.11803 type:complete len:696 (+) Transcript_7110:80-2167(+)|eukprot:CAMPEP_0119006926 /NCGR_PEP_ID=MMETSP1176-20130426/2641_1 /TAXON_ID=265551 /ORGANISM="Synedropsis recta cf, Strain CCMP1620" /LENGTH=695 /DNA_ID=CAMNT_0006958959 /DNA_START=35 /DNA_END=2122 /DNA_ORIENTATION=-
MVKETKRKRGYSNLLDENDKTFLLDENDNQTVRLEYRLDLLLAAADDDDDETSALEFRDDDLLVATDDDAEGQQEQHDQEDEEHGRLVLGGFEQSSRNRDVRATPEVPKNTYLLMTSEEGSLETLIGKLPPESAPVCHIRAQAPIPMPRWYRRLSINLSSQEEDEDKLVIKWYSLDRKLSFSSIESHLVNALIYSFMVLSSESIGWRVWFGLLAIAYYYLLIHAVADTRRYQEICMTRRDIMRSGPPLFNLCCWYCGPNDRNQKQPLAVKEIRDIRCVRYVTHSGAKEKRARYEVHAVDCDGRSTDITTCWDLKLADALIVRQEIIKFLGIVPEDSEAISSTTMATGTIRKRSPMLLDETGNQTSALDFRGDLLLADGRQQEEQKEEQGELWGFEQQRNHSVRETLAATPNSYLLMTTEGGSLAELDTLIGKLPPQAGVYHIRAQAPIEVPETLSVDLSSQEDTLVIKKKTPLSLTDRGVHVFITIISSLLVGCVFYNAFLVPVRGSYWLSFLFGSLVYFYVSWIYYLLYTLPQQYQGITVTRHEILYSSPAWLSGPCYGRDREITRVSSVESIRDIRCLRLVNNRVTYNVMLQAVHKDGHTRDITEFMSRGTGKNQKLVEALFIQQEITKFLGIGVNNEDYEAVFPGPSDLTPNPIPLMNFFSPAKTMMKMTHRHTYSVTAIYRQINPPLKIRL